ncbi:tigger transposable element-derived 6-like [Brachionus plicatilis]|uniref:Tigger transposable element-derived 6-like n=1 Tax=Brachionus plicatilis TaxID=10195 RepID=A0A3M7QXS3_BRAPC|nr:tigger transposable element-derived 6-like [Brachionus plicatilis]
MTTLSIVDPTYNEPPYNEQKKNDNNFRTSKRTKLVQKKKHIKLSSYDDVDQPVLYWFDQAQKYNNINNVRSRNGWLCNFKQRNGITTKTKNGEVGLVDQTRIQKWINYVLPDLIKDHAIDDIFNFIFIPAKPYYTLKFIYIVKFVIKKLKRSSALQDPKRLSADF